MGLKGMVGERSLKSAVKRSVPALPQHLPEGRAAHHAPLGRPIASIVSQISSTFAIFQTDLQVNAILPVIFWE